VQAQAYAGYFVAWSKIVLVSPAVGLNTLWEVDDQLAAGEIGLDSLMNLAGLNSFAADQKAMDDRITNLLAK